jgi:hypothetical protein
MMIKGQKKSTEKKKTYKQKSKNPKKSRLECCVIVVVVVPAPFLFRDPGEFPVFWARAQRRGATGLRIFIGNWICARRRSRVHASRARSRPSFHSLLSSSSSLPLSLCSISCL